MSASIDRQLALQGLALQAKVNMRLIALGEHPYDARLPEAKAIADEMCGEHWKYELDVRPWLGFVTVNILGYEPAEIREIGEPA